MKYFLKFLMLFSLSTLFFFSGCGGTNSKNIVEEEITSEERNSSVSPVASTKGYLIDSPLVGVFYTCDNKEERFTTEEGLFECVAPPVTLRIGHLTIGKILSFKDDNKVYLQDLLDLPRDNFQDETLKLLARFLQSLDNDGEIKTTISIESDIHDYFTEDQNFTSLNETDIDILLQKLEKHFVVEESALEYLRLNSEFADLNQEIVEEETNVSLDLNGTSMKKILNRGIPFGSFFYFIIPSINTNNIIGDGPFDIRYFFDDMEVSVKERMKVSIGEHNLSVIITEEHGDYETATLSESFSVFQSATPPSTTPSTTDCEEIAAQSSFKSISPFAIIVGCQGQE